MLQRQAMCIAEQRDELLMAPESILEIKEELTQTKAALKMAKTKLKEQRIEEAFKRTNI